MPCVQKPPVPGCNGPDGASQGMCAACRNKSFVKLRRDSLLVRAQNEPDGLALVGRWTDNIDSLLNSIHDDYLKARPAPPCSYAFILCGSASRKEASPYSDLDCALLIGDDTESSINAMWDLCRFIGEQIELLGERTGTSKGLRYCDGGCNPIGLKGGKLPDKRRPPRQGSGALGVFTSQVDLGTELIRTPHGMALLQETKEDHVRESLLETRLCFGDAKLHDAYRQEVATLQGKAQPEFSVRPLLRKRKREALDFLREVQTKFALPAANAEKWKLKEGFYRPAQFTAKALAYWYGIDKVVTADQVRDLVTANRLTQVNATRILDVLAAVSKIRVISQLEAQSESDTVWTWGGRDKRPDNSTEKQLTNAETQDMVGAIAKLKVLHDLVDEFVRQKTKAVGKRQNPFALATAVNDSL